MLKHPCYGVIVINYTIIMQTCPLNLIASGIASFIRALPPPTLDRRRISPGLVASPHGFLPAVLVQIDWCHHNLTRRSIDLRLASDDSTSLKTSIVGDLDVDFGMAMLLGGHVMRSLLSADGRVLALDPLVTHFREVRSHYIVQMPEIPIENTIVRTA